MTKLERRDRRRGKEVAETVMGICCAHDLAPASVRMVVSEISAALKREREEAGFAAVNYFFARKADRAKATAAILGTEKGKR